MNLTLLATLAILIGLGIAMALAVRAIGGNFTLVEDWKKAWRYYSTWGMAFVALLPDLWNGLLTAGYLNTDEIPQGFSWSIKIALIGTLIIRQVKQIKPPKLPEWGQRDEPGS